MLRARILRPRWLTTVLILWAAAWLTLPAPADGAPLPPGHGPAAEGTAQAEALAPEVATLRQALLSQGLTPADADLVLARLTPAERAELARRAGELGVGGDSGLLILVLILVVAILLYLPMAGKMQGWW
jgi:hypothetical protein